MIKFRLNLKKKLFSLIKAFGRLADHQQIPAYLVGGFVRDMILKKRNWDLDIVIEGNAISFVKSFKKKKDWELTIFLQFGTTRLTHKNGMRIDVATARKEYYPFSGALPVVQPGTIREDLFRRDFTINAMAVIINQIHFGQMVDDFSGLKDLRKKQIRILHDQSFMDDPTRILRAIRFEQRFGFTLERKTLDLLRRALKEDVVRNVKPARYFAEFRKIFGEPDPAKIFIRLHLFAGLDFLKKNFPLDMQFLKETQNRISQLRKRDLYKSINWFYVYLMILLGRLKREEIKWIVDKFQLTRIEKECLSSQSQVPKILEGLNPKGLKPSKVYQILKPLPPPLIHFIRVTTKNRIVCQYIDQYLKNWWMVKLQLDGDDLKKMGIESGQRMGQVLNELLLRKLDKRSMTKSEEMKEVKRIKEELNTVL